MKKTHVSLLFVLGMYFFASCGNSKQEYDVEEIGQNLHSMYYENNNAEDAECTQQPATVTCGMCQGACVITYFDGQIITCPSCHGNGVLSVEYLQNIVDGGGVSSNGANREFVEAEISRLENSIASMQSQLENISSETMRMYLSSQIIEMQSELQMLRSQL